MHVFDGPAVIDELARQPVEQLRMAGSAAMQAEIVGRRYESLAKVMLPKSIHQNAGSQGMIGASQPAG